MRIALVAPLAEAVPPKLYGEISELCPGWWNSLVSKGTGLLCLPAPSPETAAELVVGGATKPKTCLEIATTWAAPSPTPAVEGKAPRR